MRWGRRRLEMGMRHKGEAATRRRCRGSVRWCAHAAVAARGAIERLRGSAFRVAAVQISCAGSRGTGVLEATGPWTLYLLTAVSILFALIHQFDLGN